jgi:hypothetical protein
MGNRFAHGSGFLTRFLFGLGWVLLIEADESTQVKTRFQPTPGTRPKPNPAILRHSFRSGSG